MCDSALTWTLGRHLLRLFGGPEENGLTGGAAAPHADALNVHYVLRVLIQIPEYARARGGVHLLDEPQHADVLLLQEKKGHGKVIIRAQKRTACPTVPGRGDWSRGKKKITRDIFKLLNLDFDVTGL